MTARHDVEIEANGVDVTVILSGTAYVAGAAALRQAREVARLVELLASVDVGERDISVEDVRLHAGSGGFFGGSGSSATYTLRVRVEPVERLGDVLGAIAAHKACQTQRFAWRFPDENEAVIQCLVGAAAKARAKAKALALELGAELGPVLHAEEIVGSSTSEPKYFAPPMAARGTSAAPQPVDLGTTIQHTRSIWRGLNVRFSLAGS